MIPWHRAPFIALDSETTRVNPETARFCQAAIVTINDGPVRIWETLINPGEVPDADAQLIHRLTPELLEREGADPEDAVIFIHDQLTYAWARGLPVVIYNAPFDLTVLDRELRRNGRLDGLGRPGPVIDPMILDWTVNQYRRGSRELADVARHYGADSITGQHSAGTDALAAARIAWKIASRSRVIREMPLAALQDFQTLSYRNRANRLEKRFRRQGNEDPVNRHWPVIPWKEQ